LDHRYAFDIQLIRILTSHSLSAKRRRAQGGFIGADVILKQLNDGVRRRRVGLIVEGAPARGLCERNHVLRYNE
jgi:glycine cleavage system aminomethyltransferase T